VDEPCVRLILLYREGELRCESYSWARDLLESKIITSLENDLGKKLAWTLTVNCVCSSVADHIISERCRNNFLGLKYF
jgi:hypothetical protein